MMEVSSHIHRPPPCNGASSSHLRIKPLLPTFPAGTCHLPSRSITWRKGSSRIGFSSTITATADYSKRRPRRNSISKTKGEAPKGFMPKSPAGTSFQKKKKTNNVKKEGPGPDLGGYDGSTSGNKAELKIDDEKSRSQIVLTSSPIVSLVKTKPVADDAQVKSDGRTSSISEEGLPIGRGDDTERESFTHEISTDVAERNEENILVYSETESKDQDHDSTSLKTRAIQKVEVGERSVMLINEKGKNDQTDLAEGDEIEKVGSALGVSEGLRETKSLGDDKLDEGLSNDVEEEYAIPKNDLEIDEKEAEKMLDKDGTEEKSFAVDRWDERVVEEYNAQEIERSSVEPEDLGVRLELLENLIKENHMLGNKVCVYPEVLTPDQEIEIFFNRSISTLKDELSILIMGGFNNWRWKSFTEKLEKTTLTGDWWSCKIYVPKEAYKMDFVFFNGSEVYDNNDSMDFMLPVKGGMDEIAFEDFLLEEKRRELERLAAEEAERERRAEEQRRIEAEKAAKEEAEKERRAVEQRRIEAEKAAMEADKAQAKVEVEKRRLHLKKVMEKAVSSVENVWHIVPSNFKGEDLVRLYYNRQQRPVAHSSEVWIHGGYNSWKDGLSIVGKLVRTEKEGGDWWYAHVIVPDRALVLDWVFTDGPPESAKVYDNNNSQDFHAIVPESINEELYWVEEEHQVFKKLQDERRQGEEAIRAKAEKSARLKAEMKEKTMKAFLLSQKHIVYTEPLDVQAGSTVTVFYNPSNTVLNGKSEVWFRCAFNRWTHPHSPLPPQKMISAENGSHLKATVNVPLDAYMMDFVFSEEEDGGIFDNRNGTDYHIPVVGGIANEPPMSIVHIAVEMAPIAKVGGLGDVVTSLSRAVQDLGHNVDIILPKYDCLNLSNVSFPFF